MSATPPAAAPVKAKSKKLIVIGAVLVLLVIVGAGAAWFLASRSQAAEDEEGAEPVRKEAVKVVPTFLPMENMVVNLADPGGERVAQVGITLEVRDTKAADSVKAYMPTIRSGVLMLLSQRTAEQLLSAEGKQKLIEDILRETSVPFGGGDEEEADSAAAKKKTKKKVVAQYPVVGVLFSSLIVQ